MPLRPLLLLGAALLPSAASSQVGGDAKPRPSIVFMDFARISTDGGGMELDAAGAVIFARAVFAGGDASAAADTLAGALRGAGYAAAEFRADASSAAFRKDWMAAASWLAGQKGPCFLYIQGAGPEAGAREAFRALRRSAPSGAILALASPTGSAGALLLWRPGLKPRRITAAVSFMDLAPALLGWAGVADQSSELARLAEGGAAALSGPEVSPEVLREARKKGYW